VLEQQGKKSDRRSNEQEKPSALFGFCIVHGDDSGDKEI
jgi:hypothetical protein